MSRMAIPRRLAVAFAAGFCLFLPSPVLAEGQGLTPPTLPPAPTLTVPQLQVPSIAAPQAPSGSSASGGLTVPTITVPTITVPPVQAPSGSSASGGLTVPTITVPTITVPTIQVPSISAPTIQVPSISAPTIQVPSISVPTIQVPTIQVPTITVPAIEVPTITVPPLETPEMPELTVPASVEVASAPAATTPRRQRQPQGTTQAAPAVVVPQVTGLISPEMLLEMLRAQQAESTVELVPPQEATSTNRLPIGNIAAFGGGMAFVGFVLSVLRRRRETAAAAAEG